MEQYFNSNYELVHSLASKFIIGVTYIKNDLPVFTYVTLNKSIIGDDITKKINHSGTDLYYIFYDLLNKKWFKYSIDDELSYTYYNCELANAENPSRLYFIDDEESSKRKIFEVTGIPVTDIEG